MGCCKQILARFNFSFGNRPSSFVLILEEWTAGMDEEHLQLAIANAIHQQSGTDTGHGRSR